MGFAEVLDDASVTENTGQYMKLSDLAGTAYPGENTRKPVLGHPTQQVRKSFLK